MCTCSSFPEVVEASPTREAFVSPLTPVEESNESWAGLFVCPECGQYWYVEFGGEYDRRPNLSFKLASSREWKLFDTKSGRKRWLIKINGGLSNEQCAYSGCKEKALKSKAVCAVHGFSEYRW
jgi:hypothetical protein